MDCLKPGEEVWEVVCFVGFEADFVVQVLAAGGHCEDFELSVI